MGRRDDRCPPIPLRLAYRVPKGTTYLFYPAAAEGRLMNPRGSFDPLLNGERPIGIQISRTHRDRVLKELGIEHSAGLQRWQRAVRAWRGEGLVHGCQVGRIFLTLAEVTPAVCPDCKASWDDVPTRHLVKRDASSGEASYVQIGGPSTGTQRGEVPEEVLEEYVQENPSEDGLAAIAARRKFQEDYYGPGYKSYMDKGDLPLDADIDEHSEVS